MLLLAFECEELLVVFSVCQWKLSIELVSNKEVYDAIVYKIYSLLKLSTRKADNVHLCKFIFVLKSVLNLCHIQSLRFLLKHFFILVMVHVFRMTHGFPQPLLLLWTFLVPGE
jgi:hypothetical protein